MPMKRLSFFYLLFVVLIIGWRALANEVHAASSSFHTEVMVSSIGTSWVTGSDFFSVTGAPQRESLIGHLSLQKWQSTVEIPLEATGKTVWYSVYVTNKMKEKWENIVRDNYLYMIRIDNQRAIVPFGSLKNGLPMVFMQKDFFIAVEEGRVARVIVVSSSLERITEDKDATFFFSVNILSIEDFSRKFGSEIISKKSSTTILSVLLTILLLVCTYTFVFKRIIKATERQVDSLRLNAIISDGCAWELLYADVFRRTRSGISLCAFVGAGVSHFLSVFLLGMFWENSSSFTFFLPSFFAGGYTAGYFLVRNVLHPINKRKVLKCLFLMCIMIGFPFIVGVLALFVRNLFSGYSCGDDIVVLFSLLLNLIIGCFFGYCGIYIGMISSRKKHYGAKFPQINQVPRLVPPPPNKILRKQNVILLAGLVTYVNIADGFSKHLESSFLLTSPNSPFLWDTWIFFILSTLCVSMLGTFTLLNIEEHKWKWASFGFGSSVSLYLFLYSAVFYVLHIGSFSIISLNAFWSCILGIILFIGVLGGALSFICASALVDLMYGKIIGKDT